MGRVAIVDDTRDIVELFTQLLAGVHETFAFQSPEEFLIQFRCGAYDLILLDIVMPKLDGFEVLSRIRALDCQVPVIAITARTDKPLKDRILAAGFSTYFVKPVMNFEQFCDSVQAILQNPRERRIA